MITVSFDKCSQVFFPVRVKKQVVISRLFHDSPRVKGFIKHIHSDTVTGFHQRRRRRIVSGPDGIKANGFQNGQLAVLGIIKGNCAKHSIVVMNAATF